MQEAAEACSLDDDMADGDLGDGTGVGAAPSSPKNKSHGFTGQTETLLSRMETLGPEGEAGGIHGLKSTGTPLGTRWKPPPCGKNSGSITLMYAPNNKDTRVYFVDQQAH